MRDRLHVDIKLGDKVVVYFAMGIDKRYNIKDGDVAKVILTDQDGAWCYNPNWKVVEGQDLKIKANYMSSTQIEKVK